jgi:hypothetical protein
MGAGGGGPGSSRSHGLHAKQCRALAGQRCVHSEEGGPGGGSLDSARLRVSTTRCGDGRDLLLDGEGSLGSCHARPAAPSQGEGIEASSFVHPMPPEWP